MPVTALRELRILQMCEHPNIVQLKCVVTGNQADRYDSALGAPYARTRSHVHHPSACSC